MYSLQGLSQDFSKGGHTLSNKGYSPQFSPPECCRSFAQRHTNRGSQAPQSVIFMKKEVSSCKMSNVIFEINVINITWKHYFIKKKLDGQHLSLVCELCILQLLRIKDTMTSLWVVVMVHSPLACSCSSKDRRIRPIFPSLRASRNFMKHFSFIFLFVQQVCSERSFLVFSHFVWLCNNRWERDWAGGSKYSFGWREREYTLNKVQSFLFKTLWVWTLIEYSK